MKTGEQQYLDLVSRIISNDEWVHNERTGKNCLTVINADLEYNVGDNDFPLLTTRKSFWKGAVAEIIGYLRGYRNAQQFADLGANTWWANANENDAWLKNPARLGDGDIGMAYGVIGRAFPKVDGGSIDLLQEIYDDLRQGKDNRGEILTFYHPGSFHLACLRPCLYSHHFSVLGDTLYLNSTQRSCDVPLGLNFNMVQCYFLLAIMAQITGLKPGVAYHKIINAHIYEDQLDLMATEQIKRKPFTPPKFEINPDIKTLDDLMTWVTIDDFDVVDYEFHPPIQYPFSV